MKQLIIIFFSVLLFINAGAQTLIDSAAYNKGLRMIESAKTVLKKNNAVYKLRQSNFSFFSSLRWFPKVPAYMMDIAGASPIFFLLLHWIPCNSFELFHKNLSQATI